MKIKGCLFKSLIMTALANQVRYKSSADSDWEKNGLNANDCDATLAHWRAQTGQITQHFLSKLGWSYKTVALRWLGGNKMENCFVSKMGVEAFVCFFRFVEKSNPWFSLDWAKKWIFLWRQRWNFTTVSGGWAILSTPEANAWKNSGLF